MVEKKKKIVKDQARDTLYEKVSMKKCVGDTALTAQQSKKLLGWREVDSGDFLLKDENGVKICCDNNITNRPLTISRCQTLAQELLRGRWKFNGETIIIGKTGIVENGQHQLISLVLASQLYAEDPDKYSEYWDSEPTMAKAIIFGIDESDEVINTMDTCKPRSLEDVIYRSDLFKGCKSRQLKKLSSSLSHAVKLLWHRTGVQNAFGLRRTHSESKAFIEAHPKLLDCVRHIYEEDGKEKRLSSKESGILSSGYCAGLLYLMSTGESDATEYTEATVPEESMINFDFWDSACNFFVLLAEEAKELAVVRPLISYMINDDDNSLESRCAVIIKAWLNYSQGVPVTKEVLKLEYATDKDGKRKMVEQPCIGGIDLIHLNDAEEKATGNDPTPAEIEQRAKKVRAQDTKKTTKKEKVIPQKKTVKKKVVKKTTKKKKKKNTQLLVGKTRWVFDNEESWQGKVIEVAGNNARLEVCNGFQGAGNMRVAKVTDLLVEQP